MQPNATEIQRFFELLYAGVEDSWLVLSHPDAPRLRLQGRPVLHSDWLELSKPTWQTIAQAGQRLAQKHNVYFRVALQWPISHLQVAYVVALNDDSPPLASMWEASTRIGTLKRGRVP